MTPRKPRSASDTKATTVQIRDADMICFPTTVLLGRLQDRNFRRLGRCLASRAIMMKQYSKTWPSGEDWKVPHGCQAFRTAREIRWSCGLRCWFGPDHFPISPKEEH